MSLQKAILYRLFAGAGQPGKSLGMRGLAFCSALIVLAGLTAKITPHLMATYRHMVVFGFIFLISSLLITMLFVLEDGYQCAYMSKLGIVRYLPLNPVQVRKIYLLAYAPFSVLVTVVVMVFCLKSFGKHLPVVQVFIIGMCSCGLAVVSNIFLRVATSRLNAFAQALRLAIIAVTAFLVWRLNIATSQRWALFLAAGLVMALTVMALTLAAKPVRQNFEPKAIKVIEFRNIGIVTGMMLRAFRSGRYLGANAILIVALAGMSIIAKKLPGSLPFDAVFVFVLLLAGTFGQEARALSPRRYPLELMQYGLLGRWLLASWLLAFVNAALFICACLIIAALWFPGALSVSYWQAACIGICLVAAAILAGSLIVPERQDILVQFASTALYAGLAWAVIRTFNAGPDLVVVTAVILGISLVSSYYLEKMRWRTTIGIKIN